MRRSLRRVALAAALFGSTLGCTRTVVQQNKQPPDPLLVSKKPVQGKPMSGPGPAEMARVDPQPPPYPLDSPSPEEGRGVAARLSSEILIRPTGDDRPADR